MADTTHDFAVGIVVFPMGMTQGSVAFCSGALLAPNLVATARHCAAAISATQIDCTTATFGADYQTNQIFVTTDATITMNGNFVNVSKIITPTPAPVCGDDLALLILATNIDLPAYVTPVISPPMTDHTTYATSVTAIGYGITTPTDTTGASAGTRRIRESIPLLCIPNDTTFTDCSTIPALSGMVDSTREFVVTDGTCEGDSGSSAFDQKSFGQGVWQSFGVLSRGGVSTDGMTCQGSVYTRFDQYGPLLTSTAMQAAQMGGYTPPAWASGSGSTSSSGSTTGTGSTGGSSGAGTTGASSGGSSSGGQPALAGDGASCSADSDCASNNCISTDNTTYFCASTCSTSSDCSMGFTCVQGYCIGSAATTTAGSSSGGKSGGCSIARTPDGDGPTVPWGGVLAGLGMTALVVGRRRSRVPSDGRAGPRDRP
jgi:hypothetical protein